MKTTEGLFDRARKRLEAESRRPTPGPMSDPHTSHEAPPTPSLGLAARWSRAFGYVSLFDPIYQDWHDLPTAVAPAWAKREANNRKRRRKKGRVEPLGSGEVAHLREIREREEELEVDPREDSG